MRINTPLDQTPKMARLRLVSSQDEVPRKKKPPAGRGKRRQPPHEVEDLRHKIKTAVTAFKRAKGIKTDAEVAEICKISPTQMSYLLSKKPDHVHGVTYWTIRALADGLGVSMEWLAFAPIDAAMERAQRGRTIARIVPDIVEETSKPKSTKSHKRD